MGKYSKLRQKIIEGHSDGNIDFHSLCHLLIRMGFEERVNGSHHIFAREDVVEILNLQAKGNMAKSYQVKQVRNILIQYRLGERDVD